MKDKKILITGASGFIGSFLCERGLELGMEVWAGMRASSSRRWLQNEWLRFQTLDLTDRDRLRKQLEDFRQRHGRWDYIVHAAGATKCLDPADFDRNNLDCTVNLVETLRELDMVPRLLVYVSSLSAVGAVREQETGRRSRPCRDRRGQDWQVYDDIRETDVPVPNTAYGLSKWKSEQYLQGLVARPDGEDGTAAVSDLPFVIMRPTGVYGPRERDYFLQARSVKQHVDFGAGWKPQEITFVYVSDLVEAIYAAVGQVESGRLERINHHVYNVSDGETYSSRSFSEYIQECLGVHGVVHVKAPLWLLRTVCAVSEWLARRRGKVSTLNGDKYRILSQRNWNCDISRLREELGFEPQWLLERGTRETVGWYLKEGWL